MNSGMYRDTQKNPYLQQMEELSNFRDTILGGLGLVPARELCGRDVQVLYTHRIHVHSIEIDRKFNLTGVKTCLLHARIRSVQIEQRRYDSGEKWNYEYPKGSYGWIKLPEDEIPDSHALRINLNFHGDLVCIPNPDEPSYTFAGIQYNTGRKTWTIIWTKDQGVVDVEIHLVQLVSEPEPKSI